MWDSLFSTTSIFSQYSSRKLMIERKIYWYKIVKSLIFENLQTKKCLGLSSRGLFRCTWCAKSNTSGGRWRALLAPYQFVSRAGGGVSFPTWAKLKRSCLNPVKKLTDIYLVRSRAWSNNVCWKRRSFKIQDCPKTVFSSCQSKRNGGKNGNRSQK